jgi:hypothetical protein
LEKSRREIDFFPVRMDNNGRYQSKYCTIKYKADENNIFIISMGQLYCINDIEILFIKYRRIKNDQKMLRSNPDSTFTDWSMLDNTN